MPDIKPQPTLKVRSTRFGEVEIPADRVIDFAQGMIGFPVLKRYVMIRHRENSPFFWLQSLEAEDLAFVVVNPLIFDHQYKFTLGGAETRLLEVTSPEQVQVWVVVTIPAGKPENMTANMKAPVVINTANRRAAQVILDDPGLEVRHPLSKPAPAGGGAGGQAPPEEKG